MNEKQKFGIIMLVTVVTLAVAVMVGGCGKEASPAPPPPVTERRPTILLLYGAGFCQDCKNEFPKIAKALSGLSEAARKHLVVDLFLVAGQSSGETPTKEMAEAYAKAYLPGTLNVWAVPDPGWVNFRNHFPEWKLSVPAAAVSDNEFGIVKRWKAGSGFVSEEIVGYVRSRVGE